MGRPGAAPFAFFRSMSRSNLQKAEAIVACGWAFSSLPPARCTLICGPRVHPRYYHFMLSVRLGVDGPTRTDLPSSLARDAKGCTWQSISRDRCRGSDLQRSYRNHIVWTPDLGGR